MGLCISMDVNQKRIVIIGGGHVALRKTKVFLKEGAIVQIVAPSFHEEFSSLACHCIKKEYESQDIKDSFMVVAASNHTLVNTQVIQDAKTQGILCMSVEKERDSDMHALVYHEDDHFQLAVSTKQQAPVLNRIILEDIVQFVDTKYKDRLILMKQLRIHILKNKKIENKAELIRFLANANIGILQFLLDAIEKQSCMLLCFHGVKSKVGIEEIITFIEQLKPNINNKAIRFVFLSEGVIRFVNQKTNEILPIAFIMRILPCFYIQTKLYPMLFQEGRFYEALLPYAGPYTQVCKLPIQNQSDMRALIQTCLQAYDKNKHMICIYHSSKTGKFVDLLNEVKEEFSNVLFIHEAYKDMVNIPYHDEAIKVFPLYMLKGMHLRQDSDPTSLLLKELEKHHCTISCNTDSCLTQEHMKHLFMNKIIQEAE